MAIFISRAEIEEISEGLIKMYKKKCRKNSEHFIDIEHFIENFLSLNIEYVSFALQDSDKMGFSANGVTSVMVCQNGKAIEKVFPNNTILIDKFLLSENELGRRRFTLAHEASHHILNKMYNEKSTGRYCTEFDREKSYSTDEIANMFDFCEWQASAMGAALLMPKFIIEDALSKFNNSASIVIYGDNTITQKDKIVMHNMAKYLGVSYKALYIRLRNLKLFEYHDISDYISQELNIGGFV